METRSLLRQLLAHALGLLVFCVSASLPALAQDTGASPEPSVSPGNSGPQGASAGKQAANPDKIKQRQLARLKKMVQLTPDQESKVTPIISNFVDQLVSVRSDGSLQPDERKAKLKELRKQYNKQLGSILTQQQKQALRQARAAQRRGQGQNQNQNQNQNGNGNENENFEQGANQTGPDI